MVTVGVQAGRLRPLINFTASRLLGVGAVKSYSVYPPNFVKPIFRKDEQVALETMGELERMSHLPILPAMQAQTCSEFYDSTVDKFTNFIMRRGKKELARSLLEETFENIKRTQLDKYHKAAPEYRESIPLDPKEILYTAVRNSTPIMELMKKRIAGTTYQVPAPILERRQRFLAMNWLIRAAQDKHGRVKFSTQLAKELIDAANNEGRVVKKKQDLHRQCEANRAYAHYRWT